MSVRPAVVFSPRYACDIGAHVFPTAQYALVIEARGRAGVIGAGDVEAPEPPSRASLERVHTAAYLDDLEALRWTSRTMDSELPLTREIVDAYALACGGTTLAARRALERGTAAHVGGGFHHAFAGYAEGFCYLNDLAVAVRELQAEGVVRRVAIVDVDVHQGNGTAAIFARDPDVFTLSIHQRNNYPMPKPPSSLDVHLDDGVGDAGYLAALDTALEAVWAHAPELVLVQAGADPYVDDQLGGLALTLEGLEQRDRRILDGCVARGIAVATTLGGGYARQVADTVRIHAATCRLAIERTGLATRGARA